MTNRQQQSLPFTIAFAALVMGAIAMGISPVFVRYAEVGPFASAFWRVGLALPILFVWARMEMKRGTKQGSAEATSTVAFTRPIVWSGIFFAGDLIFWHLAILGTTVANATLLACLAPIWVVLLSGPTIGEPVQKNAYFGLILCLAGTAMLVGSSLQLKPDNVTGDIYGIITSFFFGLYFLAIRVARRDSGAGTVTFFSTAVTTIILLMVAVIAGQSLIPDTLKGARALAALGFVSHIGGQGLLTVALGSLSAVFSSLVIFIEALAGAFFGWVFFSEELVLQQWLGGALILSGVWVARPQKSDRSNLAQ